MVLASIDDPLASLDTPLVSQHTEIETARSGGKSRKRKKKHKRKKKNDDFLTVVPQNCSNEYLEYIVCNRGGSKPFTRIRVLVTLELRENG